MFNQKEYNKKYHKKYYLKNKSRIKERTSWKNLSNKQKKRKVLMGDIWRNKNTPQAIKYRKNKIIQHRKYYKKRYNNEPWFRTYLSIAQRCSPSCSWAHCYFKKGIKCKINPDKLKILWFRDKAYLMKKPSIHRINNNKNYIFSNCKYLEESNHFKLEARNRKRDENGRFLKKYEVKND